MSMIERTVADFTEVLASNAPVPGGGGASAVVGAVGLACSTMVGSLTIGNKNYADVEDEVKELVEKSEKLRLELLELVDEDAVSFEPLSRAYGIPKDDPDRDKIMEDALKVATDTPLKIMRKACEAIDYAKRMSEIGTAIALSDAGVAAASLRGALNSASLNVYINVKSMKDKEHAQAVEAEANEMIEKYTALCDEIFEDVKKRVS